MKGNVNPFEPWRPTQVNVPPPLHASRPWRPAAPRRCALGAAEQGPPIVDPANRPRNKPPERLPQQDRQDSPRSGPPLRPVPVRSSLEGRIIALAICVPLFVLGIASLDWFHSSHLPRLLALGACAGLLLVVALSRRPRWHVRLGWIAIALALAGLAAWFVPTTSGVSLWSAYHQVDEMQQLPAGDLTGYQRNASARNNVVDAFPSFAAEMATAEQAWLRRTADDLIKRTDRQLAQDPHKALADLHNRTKELESVKGYDLVKKDLEASRRRAVQACLKVVQK